MSIFVADVLPTLTSRSVLHRIIQEIKIHEKRYLSTRRRKAMMMQGGLALGPRLSRNQSGAPRKKRVKEKEKGAEGREFETEIHFPVTLYNNLFDESADSIIEARYFRITISLDDFV